MASEAVSKKRMMLGSFLDRIFMIFQTPRGGFHAPRAATTVRQKTIQKTIRPNTRHDCEAGSKMLHFGSHS